MENYAPLNPLPVVTCQAVNLLTARLLSYVPLLYFFIVFFLFSFFIFLFSLLFFFWLDVKKQIWLRIQPYQWF